MKPMTLLVSVLVLGCAAAPPPPYQPSTRIFAKGDYGALEAPSTGSLFSAESPGLFEDDRPVRVGDVIIIRIDEADSASRDDSTKLDRNSSSDYGIVGALQNELAGEVDLGALFGTRTGSSFAGNGRLSRRGRLVATLPVRVRRTLPNGDLFVEGTKVTVIGAEAQRLYISGIVRPVDILPDGSVPSSRVADAEIAHLGQGDSSDQQRAGWLGRTLGKIWPF
jgi:flagellar L-ring protein precursor FlgH